MSEMQRAGERRNKVFTVPASARGLPWQEGRRCRQRFSPQRKSLFRMLERTAGCFRTRLAAIQAALTTNFMRRFRIAAAASVLPTHPMRTSCLSDD
jgi:hypothetical protein